MMKSKMSYKSHISVDPSIRKSHMMKKPLHSRSPMRHPRGSRSPPMKHMLPGITRGHPMLKKKPPHPSRLRSIASSPPLRPLPPHRKASPASMDRVHSMKGIGYEKRKHMTDLPIRRPSPNSISSMSPMHPRDLQPYPSDRYPSTSSMPPEYGSPKRKKVKREPEDFFPNPSMRRSPPRKHAPGPPLHPDSRMSHREPPPMNPKQHRNAPSSHREKHFDGRSKHNMSPPVSSNQMKKAPMKIPFLEDENDGYRSSSLPKGYSSGAQKSYGPTLHERFSSVAEPHHSDSRFKFSREDLEKITIDIRQNLRDKSPTLRHIINPAEVKLVRRPNEGRRPIFDRDEIKHAPRDLREDAYYERKKMSGAYNSSHGIDLREVENYQITRHRFDTPHDLFSSTSGRTLNDRWQNSAIRKDAPSSDKDLRKKDFERVPGPGRYSNSSSRSRSHDRDFRSERYIDSKPPHSRPDYPSKPPLASNSRSAPYPHPKSAVLAIDSRQKPSYRKDDRRRPSPPLGPEFKGGFHPRSVRHYPDSSPPPRVERPHSFTEPPKYSYRSRQLSSPPGSPSRDKSEYGRRPEKPGYKSYSDRPSISPRGSSYFHERCGTSNYFSSRGSRPFRSPRGIGLRARGYRGSFRGTSFRGSFRGYRPTGSPRGRGGFSRR